MTRRNFFKAIALASAGAAIASTISIRPNAGNWNDRWTTPELKRRNWYATDDSYRAIHGAAESRGVRHFKAWQMWSDSLNALRHRMSWLR